MCGIVGLGDFKPRAAQWEHSLFAQMLVGNALRGTDSTGIVKVFTDGQVDWRKQIGYPYRLWESDKFGDWWKNYEKKDVRFLIGHCRFSTSGAPNVDNAHPFTRGKITLVHNGTLMKHTDLPDFDKFDVDSEAIANSIDVQGIQKTVDDMWGAYAIVYYDDKEKTLNFIRNQERPLFLGVDENIGRIYFGSEPKLIDWVLSRNSNGFDKFKMKEIPINTLISFSLNSMVPKVKNITRQYKSFAKDESLWEEYLRKGKKYLPIIGRDQADDKKDITDTIPFQSLSLPIPKDTENVKSSGKIIQIETKRQKKKEKNRKSETKSDFDSNYRAVGNLLGLIVGERIPLDILDYNKVNGHLERYLVECCHPDLPMVNVFLYIQGTLSMDGLLETGTLTGKIVSMEHNMQAIRNPKERHRIWVIDPVPKLNFKKGTEEINLTDAEEAEIIEELKKDSLWDHLDSALGD